MKRKVSNLSRRGIKVGEALSSKGDRTYEIYVEGDKHTCNCVGYAVRKKCRHIEEYLERRSDDTTS